MIKFSKKKGIAVAEYALIAVLFALILGIAIFQISPGVLKTYFIKSIDTTSTEVINGKLKLKTMGE